MVPTVLRVRQLVMVPPSGSGVDEYFQVAEETMSEAFIIRPNDLSWSGYAIMCARSIKPQQPKDRCSRCLQTDAPTVVKVEWNDQEFRYCGKCAKA